jgi:hypothetical protein
LRGAGSSEQGRAPRKQTITVSAAIKNNQVFGLSVNFVFINFSLYSVRLKDDFILK